MNLDYLKEFVVLAETCRFSEAAEQLNMTQSSLSKHIKSLEEELQAPLFVRSTRKAELSTHGRNLVPYARQIVMIYDEYTNIYRPGVYNKTRKFFIGMVPALDMKYVTVGRTGEMMHLVSAGMGIGILPYRTALSLAQGDVVIIPLAPRKDIELKIVYRRNANKDAAIIQEFLDYIESHPRQST